jgi:hypothetical protein
MPEYQAMLEAIKIGLINQVGDLVKSSGVQQYSAQHRLLCLDRIRGQLDRLKLGVSNWDGKVLHDAGLLFANERGILPLEKYLSAEIRN